MSADSFWSSVKIPYFVSPETKRKETNENPFESNQINKLKVVDLKLPVSFWGEKENPISFINNQKITTHKGKKKHKKITLLAVPEIEKSGEISQRSLTVSLEDFSEDEKYAEKKFETVPVVKRLSLDELHAVKLLMEERIRKKNRGKKKGSSETQK